MEAIVAFGLAVNICQFVDYGFQIIEATKRLSESGQIAVDPELQSSAQHIRELGLKLSAEKLPAAHSAEEEQLHKIAQECATLSAELLATLEASNSKRPNSKLHSFFAVLRFKNQKALQDALESKLDRCRSQLQIQLTAMMRLVKRNSLLIKSIKSGF
jgi:hypothetical protein